MGKNTEVFDKDINPILEIAPNQDLDYLVKLITGTFSNFLDVDEVYKKNSPNHKAYADLLAKEICEYGGNGFVNMFRGAGPSYKEIVCDVASKLGAPYNSKQDIEKIEDAIIAVILEKTLEKMSDEEKRKLLEEMGGTWNPSLTGPALTSAFIALFKMGGFKSYQITLIVVNAIAKFLFGRGIAFAANTAMMRWAAVLVGPIGWAITGIWTTVDLAGPAYRVTIPTVIYIAMLRKKYNSPACPSCKQMIPGGIKFCPECGAKL